MQNTTLRTLFVAGTVTVPPFPVTAHWLAAADNIHWTLQPFPVPGSVLQPPHSISAFVGYPRRITRAHALPHMIYLPFLRPLPLTTTNTPAGWLQHSSRPATTMPHTHACYTQHPHFAHLYPHTHLPHIATLWCIPCPPFTTHWACLPPFYPTLFPIGACLPLSTHPHPFTRQLCLQVHLHHTCCPPCHHTCPTSPFRADCPTPAMVLGVTLHSKHRRAAIAIANTGPHCPTPAVPPLQFNYLHHLPAP